MERRSWTCVALAMVWLYLVPNAIAETISLDVDGDNRKDAVTASQVGAADIEVSAALSAYGGKVAKRRYRGGFVSEPYFRTTGNVDQQRGAELFVRTAHISTYDSISVLTVHQGQLVKSGTFFIDGSLTDGYAMGIKCGRVNGRPGLRAYRFSRGGAGKNWSRKTKAFVWKKGKLLRKGKERSSHVRRPSPAETRIGCAMSKVPPVLGKTDNGAFAGLGTQRPASFSSMAGFERFWGITWKGWGRKQASATGWFNAGHAGDPDRKVKLIARKLGLHRDCGKRRAYRRLTVKISGQRASTVDVC